MAIIAKLNPPNVNQYAQTVNANMAMWKNRKVQLSHQDNCMARATRYLEITA
ncbi:MAG TPA: hypothetical protein VGL94_03615 [Ktedonobacteraceae bacterium]|jgi:hypothetical protein